jgi:hypothetical protein
MDSVPDEICGRADSSDAKGSDADSGSFSPVLSERIRGIMSTGIEEWIEDSRVVDGSVLSTASGVTD